TWILHGNVTERGDVGGGPGRPITLKSVCPELGFHGGERRTFAASGAPPTTLENPREGIVSMPDRLITAAGLQGEQPLVDRTM
ncbi:hypothetical protein N7530_012859, partial [Penicillium desertorum]